jgi:hypothetical protein
MDSLAGTLVYGIVKWMAYTAWCWVGLHWAARASGVVPSRVAPGRALAAGSTRWLLGLAFGVVIFFAFATTRERVWQQYVAVYVPVRCIEWSIIGLLFAPSTNELSLRRKLAWVAAGVAVSFASDMVSPQMIEEGRFCVGRCLC